MDENIKELRQRCSSLELDVSRLTNIINSIPLIISDQQYVNHNCGVCGCVVEQVQVDSCPNNDCPHGLCK